MSIIWLPRDRLFLATFLIIFVTACVQSTPAPSPEIVPGIYIQSGFEFYRWEEGLTVMIWHDGIKSSSCENSIENRRYALRCSAANDEEYLFNWSLETTDGVSAEFSINNQSYDLEDGKLFIVNNSEDGLEVAQLHRDLSRVAGNAESVIEFGLYDTNVRDYIQSQAHIVGCISSYYISDENPPEFEEESARETLFNFFSYLHAEQYAEAVDLYGGQYTTMQEQNPTLNPKDYAALFRNACTINGAQCLEVNRVILLDRPSATEFRFAVEFTNDDGSLFTLAPCCGGNFSEGSRQTEFIYTTRLECTGRYRVMNLPVYLP